MQRATRIARRNAAALVLVALAVVMFGGSALAGHVTSNVKSYTGCLVPNDGVIIKVKEGDAPKSACTGGQTQVHFSGGDISKISVGSGLTLPNGGDNGEVRIALAAGQALPQCAAGQVAEWDGSAWVCGAPYSNGTGLDLAGKTFSIDEDYRVKNTSDCDAGKFVTGFDNDNEVTCAPPQLSLPSAWEAFDIDDAPEGSRNEVVSLSLPRGNYLVNVTGNAADDGGGDNDVDVQCWVDVEGDGDGFATVNAADDSSPVPHATVAMTTLVTLNAAADVVVECISYTGSDHVLATMTAVHVGTLTNQ